MRPLREIETIIRIGEFGGIRQVEEFSPEVQIARFNQWKHSLHSHIYIVLTRASHNAYSAIAEVRIAGPLPFGASGAIVNALWLR